MKPHLGQTPQDPGPQLQEGGGWGDRDRRGCPCEGRDSLACLSARAMRVLEMSRLR